jgi:hypothetical protein
MIHMKILTKITILASLLAIGLGTTFATTTDAIMIGAGGESCTIYDNLSSPNKSVGGGCAALLGDLNPIAGTDTVAGTVDGWTISITSGTSASPSDVPVGLDISSFTATCTGAVGTGCSKDALDIQFSDINFSPANPAFVTGYSLTSLTGTGSTSESAYYSNSNKLFAETTLIGKVGPFTGLAAGSATGGVGSVAPYSLTLDQAFAADAGGASVSYSADGAVSSVPEPAAVVLLGTVLLFCASKLRRRRAS